MDLKEYYNDLRKHEARLEVKHPDGIVYVTSVFHRERNSTAGSTLSATCRNAARVLTDGTHREATDDEISSFLQRQQDELRRNAAAEQKNKRQYIVVVDQHEGAETTLVGADSSTPTTAGKGRALTNGK